ncbi:MAG: tetratricopeptide repeat protein [Planctomycetota bacterium]
MGHCTARSGQGIKLHAVRFQTVGFQTVLLCLAAAALVSWSSVGCSATKTKTPAPPKSGSPTNDLNAGQPAGTPTTPPSQPASPGAGGNPAADRLIEQVQLDGKTKAQEAQYFLSLGNRWYNENDYRRAEEFFEKALQLDPSLQEARRKKVDCMMFQGKRDGEIKTVIEQFAAEREVATQQRLEDTRRLIALGKQHLANDNVQAALDNFVRARNNLLWFEYGTDITALKHEAESLFDAANQQKLVLEKRIEQEKSLAAKGEAERRTAEAENARLDRIASLLRRARDSRERKEYRSVVELTEKVLELDPENEKARKLRAEGLELSEARRRTDASTEDEEQTRRTTQELRESAVPISDPFKFTNNEDEWRVNVKQRAAELSNVALEEDFEIQKIRKALIEFSPSFQFDGEPLGQVVEFLRTITDLNITIDPEIDENEVKVRLKLDGVRLEQALDLIMKNTELAYTFKENTLFITKPENAHGDTVFHIYSVADILNRIRDFPGPQIRVQSNDEADSGSSPFGFNESDEDEAEPLTGDGLKDLIVKSTGGEEVWTAAKSDIVPSSGQLLITATRELHEAVRSFLDNLRKNSDLFIIVEARFIDLLDDFLEDIGVDSRNLGQPPGVGFGTAYGNGLINSSATGGRDYGFGTRGNPTNPSLVGGLDRTAGRVQHILDGFVGAAQGTRLDSALKGLTLQVTWLDPFQLNAILRASQETRTARTITAPRITASNGQRVHVSVITQRSYVQDYELVSGGTGLVVQEVADPVIATFQDGVILDVRPVISADRKYITLDVRPTLATLVNGQINSVTVSLGSLLQAATLVQIDLPEISLQQAFTSVTVPDGGTVLLGGFRSMNERKYESFIPFVGRLPIIKNVFRRKVFLSEKRSLYILLTAKVVDLREEERRLFN